MEHRVEPGDVTPLVGFKDKVPKAAATLRHLKPGKS